MTGNRLWMLGVALVAVIVVAFGWLFAISPMLAQADLASSQAQSAQAQNDVQRIGLVRLKKQFEDMPKLREELDTLQRAVPANASLDDFLDQLQKLAQSTGVAITGFTAAEATRYGGNDAAKPDASADGSDAAAGDSTGSSAPSVTDKLFTVPISVVVKGTPDKVMAFTNASQKGERFFLVTSDTFTGSRDHPEDDGGTLTGFVFVVRDGAAPTSDAE